MPCHLLPIFVLLFIYLSDQCSCLFLSIYIWFFSIQNPSIRSSVYLSIYFLFCLTYIFSCLVYFVSHLFFCPFLLQVQQFIFTSPSSLLPPPPPLSALVQATHLHIQLYSSQYEISCREKEREGEKLLLSNLIHTNISRALYYTSCMYTFRYLCTYIPTKPLKSSEFKDVLVNSTGFLSLILPLLLILLSILKLVSNPVSRTIEHLQRKQECLMSNQTRSIEHNSEN